MNIIQEFFICPKNDTAYTTRHLLLPMLKLHMYTYKVTQFRQTINENEIHKK